MQIAKLSASVGERSGPSAEGGPRIATLHGVVQN
jgi:hypothetical protein